MCLLQFSRGSSFKSKNPFLKISRCLRALTFLGLGIGVALIVGTGEGLNHEG